MKILKILSLLASAIGLFYMIFLHDKMEIDDLIVLCTITTMCYICCAYCLLEGQIKNK
jgi:hypothetical protein